VLGRAKQRGRQGGVNDQRKNDGAATHDGITRWSASR
jgi:hypothetical protein